MGKRIAAAALGVALATGCSGAGESNVDTKATQATESMARSDPTGLFRETDGFGMGYAAWQQPERAEIGGVNVTIYQEIGTPPELRKQLEADIPQHPSTHRSQTS